MTVGATSRHLRLGGGSVAGGRVGLAMAPDLLRRLSQGRTVALVSATNGKTTTTRLLATAVGRFGQVATSTAGANLPPGIAAALASARPGVPAVLEVDEAYLAAVADAVHPTVVVLLNLSRDQMDRVSEVRSLAIRWRAAMTRLTEATVVANADDPLVAWAASAAPHVQWVAAGQLWRGDATGCPACDGRIEFDLPGGSWQCGSCGLARPVPDATVEPGQLVLADGRHFDLPDRLPGRCNQANAAMAAVAAQAMGIDMAEAIRAMAEVVEVEGRFAEIFYDGIRTRLLLAKNPAGWVELLDLLKDGSGPVVVGINARIADGRDPSWLWDVAFDRLAGRPVVATGERARDLAVRLRYAGLSHQVEPDQLRALRTAAGWLATSAELGPGTHQLVEYVGNYTAFQDLRHHLGRVAVTHEASRRHWRLPFAPRQVAGGDVAVTARSPLDAADRLGAGSAAGAAAGAAGAGAAAGAVDLSDLNDLGDLSDRPGSAMSRQWPGLSVVEGFRPSARALAAGASALRIVVVHPDLLGTYGDAGNGIVLAGRAARRGLAVELVLVHAEDPMPETGDIYLLGGGEDGPQVQSAALLVSGGSLVRAVGRGATVLAVCAGYQMVGMSFPGADAQPRPGLGLLDVTTVKRTGRRAVGELLAQPEQGLGAGGGAGVGASSGAGVGRGSGGRQSVDKAVGGDDEAVRLARSMVLAGGVLTGFENHGGATVLGAGVTALARVVKGSGNDGGGSEGAWQGRVVGTYLHGPVLARNPVLADALLTMATGTVFDALQDLEEEALRGERVAAVGPVYRARRRPRVSGL